MYLNRLCMIIITISLFVPVTSHQNIDQVDIIVSIPVIEIVFNQTASFNVTVLDSGVPVENVYFYFEKIDISETQRYIGSGIYQLNISQHVSTEIIPGAYTVTLYADTVSDIILTDVDINMSNTDNIRPVLSISPDVNELNSTVFNIIINGSDDLYWKSVNISLGDINLFYFENRIDVDNDNIIFNKTDVYINTWIDLTDITSSSNVLSIIIMDWAYNNDTHSILMQGDYIRPQLEWTSHAQYERIYSRQITLSWKVNDSSDIIRQQLYIDGNIYYPNGEQLGSKTQVSFFYAIPEDVSATIFIELIVFDSYNNRASIKLELLYDTADDNTSSISVVDNEIVVDVLIALLIILLIVAVAYIALRINRSERNVIKRMKNNSALDINEYESIISDLSINDDEKLLMRQGIQSILVSIDMNVSENELFDNIKLELYNLILTFNLSFDEFQDVDKKINKLLS